MEDTKIKVGKYTFNISHPRKVLYPEQGITKKNVVEYYKRISETMLPHIKGRLLVMHRFPDGIDGEDFYQKTVPDYFPDWIKRKSIQLEKGGTDLMMLIEKAADLVYLAGQACLVPHIWLSTESKLHRPDKIIFDLDPEGNGFEKVKSVAKKMKHIFEEMNLKPFVMTTGSKGLHVVSPIKRDHTFDEVREFAKKTAQRISEEDPDEVTIETHKKKRKGRLFLDYLRNAYGQTAVAPYALRALRGAPVAAPLDWEELEDSDLNPQSYTIENIFRRLGNKKDPWSRIKKCARTLKL